MARYSFWGTMGMAIGLDRTDDLEDALVKAENFECEIFDDKLQMFVYQIGERGFHFNKDWVLAIEKGVKQ